MNHELKLIEMSVLYIEWRSGPEYFKHKTTITHENERWHQQMQKQTEKSFKQFFFSFETKEMA